VLRDRESKGGIRGLVNSLTGCQRGGEHYALLFAQTEFALSDSVLVTTCSLRTEECCQTGARKQSDSGSLGVFLSPRLTRRGIVVMMFLGRLDIGLQKPK
jgi:hypothetical protein